MGQPSPEVAPTAQIPGLGLGGPQGLARSPGGWPEGRGPAGPCRLLFPKLARPERPPPAHPGFFCAPLHVGNSQNSSSTVPLLRQGWGGDVNGSPQPLTAGRGASSFRARREHHTPQERSSPW